MLRPGFPGRALTVHGTSTGRTHFPFVHRGRAVGIALVAGVLSGLPSTAWAVLKGEDPLAAARAAGTLLPGRPDRPGLTLQVREGQLDKGKVIALLAPVAAAVILLFFRAT